MQIDFAHNDGPSLGVEVELSLVDVDTRDLTDASTAILSELGNGDPHGHPKAKHELFECTLEIITGVCTTAAEARSDLEGTLAEVRGAAAGRGVIPISVGTHPFARWRDQTVSGDPRYAELVDELQWTARRLAIYGVHFHVGVRSGEKAVAITNALRRYLPLFIALSASSPFWEDEDSGLASSRIKVFESLPTAGLNPPIADWDEFEQLMGTLVRARCIRSIREIWWDIRPHPNFGTVELRMCDAPQTLRETTALAAMAQCLVESLSEQYDTGVLETEFGEWTVRENKWLATRHGVEAELIAERVGTRRPAIEIIEDLIEYLEPMAVRLDCVDELADVRRILDHGPGYRRQRAISAAGGSATDIVDALIRELESDEPFLP